MAQTPLGDVVWIELPEICERTAGGLYILPDETARQQQGSEIGKILGIGPKAFADEPIKPKVGDYISFARYAGRKVEVPHGKRPQRLIYADDAYSILDDEYLKTANVVVDEV